MEMRRWDLGRIPLVKAALRSRWPQLLIMTAALAGLVLAIVAGLAGTPVGSRNFSIVVVWIAWWALLMLVAVPLLGRVWCSVCPIPAPGEWLQRGALLGPTGRGLGSGRRWPRRLRNIWLQNAGFVLLALFAAVILTQPLVTALLLLGLFAVAIGTSLVYERRAFCRYLCPVGGFIGLYSQLAPVELRVKDSAVCAKHTVKTCYTGNEDGYGCPWQVFPAGLIKNINCGLCFECVRTCPYDNIAFNLRPFGVDLLHPSGRRLDEAFKAFIMLGSAIVYIAVMLGPWGELKSAAYAVGTLPWLLYAAAFLFFVLALVPGTFLLAVLLGRRFTRADIPAKKAFSHFAYALIPLGLGAWIAFSLSFVFANLSYVWPVLSDPLGWGWNLLGTAGLSWTPYLTGAVPFLQVGVLVSTLAWSSATAQRIARGLGNPGRTGRPAALQALPVSAFSLVLTLAILVLLLG
jgi:ferredoxin